MTTKLLLIYPGVDPGLTQKQFLTNVKILNIKRRFNSLVSRREQEQGEFVYLVIIMSREDLTIKDPSVLAVSYQGETYVPKLKKMKSFRSAFLSACMDKDYEHDFECIINGHLMTSSEFAEREIIEKGFEEALANQKSRTPNQIPLGLSAYHLESYYCKVENLVRMLMEQGHPLERDLFEMDPSLKKWFTNPAFMSVIWYYIDRKKKVVDNA